MRAALEAAEALAWHRLDARRLRRREEALSDITLCLHGGSCRKIARAALGAMKEPGA